MMLKRQQLIQQFKSYLLIQKQRSPHTVKNYISDIDQFVSMTKVNDILLTNKPMIDDYLHSLNSLNLSPKSIHRKLSSLDHFFEFLIQNDHVTDNPWKSIRRPRIHSNIPTYLEESVILELLERYPTNSNEDIRNKAILELLFSSGIRVSECVQLNIQDISFESLECIIQGKGDKERITLFGQRCQQWLSHYLNHVYSKWGRLSSNKPLFISKKGTRITQRTIQRIVKDANQFHSSSIEITPHTCRHSCASMLLTNGANIRDIQDLLGHSSIITTQRYANIPTKKLKERFLDVMDN